MKPFGKPKYNRLLKQDTTHVFVISMTFLLFTYHPVLDDATKKEIETKAQVKNQHQISEQKDELSRGTGVFPFMLWFRYY